MVSFSFLLGEISFAVDYHDLIDFNFSGSTFSSQHSVLNIRDRLVPLYNHFDPVCLEKMVKKSYPLFTRHWDEAVSTLENSSQNNGLLTLEEASVAEVRSDFIYSK